MSTFSNPPPYRRKVYALQRTYSTNNRIQFDFRSALSADWAAKWISLHGGLKTPLSGLVRRALAVYVTHLYQLPADTVLHELRSVAWACSGTGADQQEQEAAVARLDAFTGTELPPLDTFLHAPHVLAERAVHMARLAVLNEIPTKKVKRT